jgi:hypothetical protein
MIIPLKKRDKICKKYFFVCNFKNNQTKMTTILFIKHIKTVKSYK